jgi:hypothetical protein
VHPPTRPDITQIVEVLAKLRALSEPDWDVDPVEEDRHRAELLTRKNALVAQLEAAESAPPPIELRPRPSEFIDQFDWGSPRMGTADLAHRILACELGETPPPAVYMRFAEDVVSKLARHSFRLEASSVWSWIEANRALVERELFEKLQAPLPETNDGKPALAVTDIDPDVASQGPIDEATGSAVVRAGEAAWSAIQTQHPELPDAVIVLGTGVERGRLVKLGHWWGGRWLADGAVRGEVLLAGEALHLPAEAVFEVLLHEAAHGLNAARGIKDTSRGGRYHNAKFKTTAEEVGLDVRPMRPYGWARTTLSSTANERYAPAINQLGDAMRIARQLDAGLRIGADREEGAEQEGTSEGDGSGANGRARVRAARCGCGRRLRMAPSVLAAGPVVCGLCETEFTVEGATRAPQVAERGSRVASADVDLPNLRDLDLYRRAAVERVPEVELP